LIQRGIVNDMDWLWRLVMVPSSFFKKCFLTIMVSLLLGVTGCALSLFPQPGAVAHKENRVGIVEGKTQNGTVGNDDLVLNYSLTAAQDTYSLSGTVEIQRSITMSFSSTKSLFIKMSFLDASGTVLQTVDVTPLVPRYNSIPEKMEMKRSGQLPAGAQAVAFSWYGSFYSGRADVSGSWDIHYFPFTKQ